MALRKLNTMIERERTSYILDADIKGFFDHLDHEWIVRFIGSKIKDPNIIRLIRRLLRAGIMKDYQFEETEEGSGQGSVCSPILWSAFNISPMQKNFMNGLSIGWDTLDWNLRKKRAG